MHKCPKIFTAFCSILLLSTVTMRCPIMPVNKCYNWTSSGLMTLIPRCQVSQFCLDLYLIVCIDIHLIRAYIFLQIKSRITSFSSIPVVKFTYCYRKTTQYCIEFDMIYYENSYCSLYKRQPLQTPKFS